MITILFAVSLLAQQPLSQQDALSSFRVRFSEGQENYGKVDVPKAASLAHRLWEFAAFPEDQKRKYWENSMSVTPRFLNLDYRNRVGLAYSTPTGRLFACGISYPSENRAPNLSIDQCVEKVKEYYRLVGGTNTLSLQRAEIDLSMDRETFLYVYVSFSFTAPGTAYRFASGIEAIVDRTYGTPENMQIGEIPPYDAPANVVSKDDAVANAIAAASQYTGWSVLEGASQEPMFHVPDYLGMPNRMQAVHKRRLSEGKACLVYEVTVHDASVDLPTGDRRRPFVQVYVDAETGQPIGLLPVYKRIGALSEDLPRRAFDWSGTWAVGSTTGKILPSSKEPPFAQKRVLLVRDSQRVLASYDPASGLVWLISGGKAFVGEPDGELRLALALCRRADGFEMDAPQRANN
ncbi:MAG: hypothetical protein L6Q31_08115 [Fimbriimonadaceae bacterium]|uniref:Uncharacterized protein n=1 Tax=Candidatus Nitrosymbiomonas proteolyticus TaxID=2608984 RepID=A0A809S6I9_9BACT|nr:hypothetical protein [Fimbriimonadaceae bacterium]NUM39522.1 hypothetical protein [Armatimonadota bacterium]BBO24907.1 conserved hypothetical protein [Candidatus Nitrosymbiomonas proteolyticus]